eukprot:6173421-Pleurochrysis_carterae.AAC.1
MQPVRIYCLLNGLNVKTCKDGPTLAAKAYTLPFMASISQLRARLCTSKPVEKLQADTEVIQSTEKKEVVQCNGRCYGSLKIHTLYEGSDKSGLGIANSPLQRHTLR